eukprot:c11236_g1_i1 orf=202-492(+)
MISKAVQSLYGQILDLQSLNEDNQGLCHVGNGTTFSLEPADLSSVPNLHRSRFFFLTAIKWCHIGSRLCCVSFYELAATLCEWALGILTQLWRIPP